MKAFIIAVAPLFALALACASTSSATVSSVDVTPSPCTVSRTNSVHMVAMATYPDGKKADVSGSVAWTTGNSQTATVNPSGVVVGVNSGVTAITATYQGASGKVDCTVTP